MGTEAGRGGSALLPGAAERWRGAGAGDFLRELRRGAGGFGSVEEPPLAVLCLDSKSASTDGLVTGTPRATWSLLPVLRLLLLLAAPFAFATRAGSFSSSSTASFSSSSTASAAGTSFSSVTPSAVAACFARARRYQRGMSLWEVPSSSMPEEQRADRGQTERGREQRGG